MRVTLSRRARANLEKIRVSIAREDPVAAQAVVTKIRKTTNLLSDQPEMGKLTSRSNIRVINLARYPYRIFYRVFRDRREVRVLTVMHAARGVRF